MTVDDKITLNVLFINSKVAFLYRSIYFLQFSAALGSCIALSPSGTRTGWAQTFAALGGAVLVVDGPADLLARRLEIPARVFFGFFSFTFAIVFFAVLALGANTEDSRDEPLNGEEVALGFLVAAWGCQTSKLSVAFAHHALDEGPPLRLSFEDGLVQ